MARLHAMLELLPTALDRHLGPVGLTSFEYTVLSALAQADHGRLRLSALASRTNATLARLSRVASSLERKGLIVRAPCAQDGRATNAVLTTEGRRAWLRAEPLYAHAVRTMVLDGLQEGQSAQLSALMLAILGNLDPDRRLAITADLGEPVCAADPVPAQV